MFDVCIANFVHGPWDIRLRDEIFQTFVNYKKKKFNIDKIDGYPKKKYDFIFLPGIRLIKKKHLDIKLLRKFVDISLNLEIIQAMKEMGQTILLFNRRQSK